MKKIALIFGGSSTERMVSVASAQNLVKYFDNPDLYFISKEGPWYKTSKQSLIDHKNPFKSEFVSFGEKVAENVFSTKQLLKDNCIFIALHGTEGEDGSIQQFFEENKISFTGSGSLSSALCFDKVKTKSKAKSQMFPLAKELVLDFSKPDSAEKVKTFFNDCRKIVLKPVANGSSFGLFIVDSLDKLNEAISSIKSSTEKYYLCEEFIVGRELTVGVYQNTKETKALCASEVLLDKGSNFDYEGKYLGVGSKEITPAQVSAEEAKLCQDLALKSHQVFNCYGYSRTDMILTAKGPVFLETNTLPGMTKASFYPQQLEAEKLSFQTFINDQIEMALRRN
jgi:D-alanine-D-alanine ligase